MADLISKKSLVTKLSQGYWDCKLQQAKNDPCVIDAMIDWAIRIVNEMPLESSWHTGIPKEEGWYLVKYECIWEGRHKGKQTYHAVHIYTDKYGLYTKDGSLGCDDVWKPIAWQKITPYEEN